MLRGVFPASNFVAALGEADEALRAVTKQSVPDSAWAQSSMSSSDGGLGLRYAVDIAHPAFLGSVADTADTVCKILGRHSVNIPRVREAGDAFVDAWRGWLATAF